jgi:putative glutamine amidotransferase
MCRAGEDVTAPAEARHYEPMKPTIGITRCSSLEDYVASIEQSGGRARILEVTESPKNVLAEIQGLLLTGGGDVDPAFYGEDRDESIHDAEPGRDEFEIDLARRAIETNLPVLAICRGAQVLNVAAGGSLVQDIPSAVPTDLPHTIERAQNEIAHEVVVTTGSKLERVLGAAVSAAQTCRVNSRHHQSVSRVGRNLTPSATAPDGVVEAIEAPSADFCIGVQWHPENFWRSGEFKSLFDTFVAAATSRVRS